MQGKMIKERKSRAFNPRYVSPSQGILPGFEHPFDRELDPSNRWVVLSHLIPWDELCNSYVRQSAVSGAGRKPVNPRIVLGSLIIKYTLNLDDRETVDQISENIYMQYFLGYPSFTSDKPFDASLFVDIRKRFSLEVINEINEKIVRLKTRFEESSNTPTVTSALKVTDKKSDTPVEKSDDKEEAPHVSPESGSDESKDVTCNHSPCQSTDNPAEIHKGRLLIDATVCPQDIAYPTDLDLLSDAREKSELLIDSIYERQLHGDKPRTYRKVARKEYLHTAQKKKKTKKQIRSAIRKQLGYLCRNIRSINRLLDAYPILPFDKYERKYFYVIQTLFDQQLTMFKTRTHSIEDRIVSIHQPHVRPVVRGKKSAKVEFGSKIQVAIVNGISFLDKLSWDAYNEGSFLEESVEKYKARFGFYPKELLADKIYCTRDNRKMLKGKGSGILLRAKPLGRPSSATALSNHVSPGERNPIEGKFGQAKTAYGMNRIKARLKITSESWIAGIILVLNLVKLAGAVAPCLIVNICRNFSAWLFGLAADLVTMRRGDIFQRPSSPVAVA
jgi:hypothetical protein